MIKEIHETGALFEAVQVKNILGDGKTFPDCIPTRPLTEINTDYLNTRELKNFDLKLFIEKNFTLPQPASSTYKSDPNKAAQEHITALWDVLTRKPDEKGGSLIPLPYPYIVPGGRFGELYYWDSYFTMLGLEASGRTDMIRNMVRNFSYLIDTIGYIPNGNRTYFIGRSQPPFFSLMVKLLSRYDKDALLTFLPQLQKEYSFWMKGSELVSKNNVSSWRVVRMPNGEILNRYWDENNTPRPESHKEDVELSHHSSQRPEELFRHIRAAAESGWDFSTRWFKDVNSFASIHTTEIIPVDLNCLLLHLEQMLAKGYQMTGDNALHAEILSAQARRKTAILNYCWNEDSKFFFDFDFVALKQKTHVTLAGTFPLFFDVASSEQALIVAEVLKAKFLKPGGLTTTLEKSGQQWDAPNGWAPLQWIAYKGLRNYGLNDLATQVKSNWFTVNEKVYKKTGKMTEKYDVWSDDGDASGGEYPNQDGFGWTNGVYLALIAS